MHELRAGVYKHYKGMLVHILGPARHSETDEKLVAYIPLGVKTGPRITVRPYDMFFQQVDQDGKKIPRFEFIGEEVSQELASEYLPDAKRHSKGEYEY